MNFNKLLDDDYRYKWYILQILELKKDTFFTIDNLISSVGISRYKVERLLDEVIENAAMNSIDIKINIESNGEIYTKGLSNLTLKKIRLYYLENSVSYIILRELFINKDVSMEELIDTVFISRSKVYEKLKLINLHLLGTNIKIKNLRLEGEELSIRGLFLSLYMEFYNGIRLPFDDETNKVVQEIKRNFEVQEKITLTKTQEFKFCLFVGIVIIRLKNEHGIRDSSILYDENNLDRDYVEFSRVTNIDKEFLENDLILILYFSVVEGFITSEKYSLSCTTVSEDAKQISNSFFSEVSKLIDINQLQNISQIKREMNRINQKWLYFHFKDTTFIKNNKYGYLQEIYPEYDAIIRNFLEQNWLKKFFFSEEEKIKIYYDYLFLLSISIPLELVGDKIYICVDFSHGEIYNKFLEKNIQSFRDLNVSFEKNPSINTDIYISDFVVDNLDCVQIIWKNPPESTEWKEFGDQIVLLKKRNSNE